MIIIHRCYSCALFKIPENTTKITFFCTPSPPLSSFSSTGQRNFNKTLSSCSSVSADPTLKNTLSSKAVKNVYMKYISSQFYSQTRYMIIFIDLLQSLSNCFVITLLLMFPLVGMLFLMRFMCPLYCLF